MDVQKLRAAVTEVFKFLPRETKVVSFVAASQRDNEGLRIAEGVITKFASFNKNRGIKSPANQMMIVEGTPFSERLDFVADKLELRTFSYVATGESNLEFTEQLLVMQEQVVRHMIGENGVLIAFPKSKCPKMILPRNDIETMKYRTWGAVAMAIKLGIPVMIYVPSIKRADQFLGPMVSRGKILSEGDWGAWVSASPISEDSDEGVKVMDKWDESQKGHWVEGVASRPNWFKQN